MPPNKRRLSISNSDAFVIFESVDWLRVEIWLDVNEGNRRWPSSGPSSEILYTPLRQKDIQKDLQKDTQKVIQKAMQK